MRSFSRDTWIGVAGLIIGVIGLATSYFFYQEAKETRDLVFALEGQRTEIISAARIGTAPIRVTQRDGSPILGDIYSVRFYLWNDGKRAIRDTDILSPITISLGDEKASLLDYRIVDFSRKIVSPRLSRADTASRRELIVSFRILEQKDGIAGQIIYQGGPNVPITVTGLAEGVPTIRTTGNASWLNVFGDVLGLSVAFLIMGAVTFFLPWGMDKLDDHFKAQAWYSHTKTWLFRILAIAFVCFVVWLVVSGFQKKQRELQSDVASEAPGSLRR
jgi:hypothetical protein